MLKLSTMLHYVWQYVRPPKVREIPAREVRERLGDPEMILLDANLWGQWVRGHIPGARYVGLEFAPADLPPDKDAMLVFYCESAF